MTNITRKPIMSILSAILLCILVLLTPYNRHTVNAAATDPIPFIVLNSYTKALPVGGDFQLIAVTSTGKLPTFKSSSSAIASVSAYGLITAKKAGTCRITAKIKKAEAVCQVTVTPTIVTLETTSLSMENGHTHKLTASVSTGHEIVWKSSKSSIASVDEEGVVTAKKPGTVTITAKSDGTIAKCRVTVRKPTLTLSIPKKKLYRLETVQLTANVSSGKPVTWKSSKSSVATVNEDGLVTAVKHGTATITAKVDGVSKTCTITVQQPKIKLSAQKLSMTIDETAQLTATVSSGITPEWSSSNINIVSVDDQGRLCARQKGRAYIYAREDGVKVSCIVTVSE